MFYWSKSIDDSTFKKTYDVATYFGALSILCTPLYKEFEAQVGFMAFSKEVNDLKQNHFDKTVFSNSEELSLGCFRAELGSYGCSHSISLVYRNSEYVAMRDAYIGFWACNSTKRCVDINWMNGEYPAVD